MSDPWPNSSRRRGAPATCCWPRAVAATRRRRVRIGCGSRRRASSSRRSRRRRHLSLDLPALRRSLDDPTLAWLPPRDAHEESVRRVQRLVDLPLRPSLEAPSCDVAAPRRAAHALGVRQCVHLHGRRPRGDRPVGAVGRVRDAGLLARPARRRRALRDRGGSLRVGEPRPHHRGRRRGRGDCGPRRNRRAGAEVFRRGAGRQRRGCAATSGGRGVGGRSGKPRSAS